MDNNNIDTKQEQIATEEVITEENQPVPAFAEVPETPSDSAPDTTPAEPVVAPAQSEEVESPTPSPVAPIASDTPEEPVVAPATPETAEVKPEPEQETDFFTIRSQETGDKVYVVKNKKRYWVRNPETLAKLGFYLGKEKNIPFTELLQYPEGESVDLTIPGAIVPWEKPESEQPAETNQSVWN